MSQTSKLAAILPLLACPRCGGGLEPDAERLVCSGCATSYPVTDGIPQLFAPNEWPEGADDVTDVVRAFYEETPFPNYEEFDSVASLVQKARAGRFAKLLDDQIPPGSRVLECGCGTGQLSNFLSIANRTVFGTDMCLNSLRLGREFQERAGLERVQFLQMNLFRPCLRAESFDLAVCNGVLHHTSDPRGGLASIARLVRPGGHVILGLYHRYGRLVTDLRRLIFRVSRDRFTFLDPNLRSRETSAPRWKAWFMDQYKHPHETKHTIGQVLRWLPPARLEFVKSLPASRPFQPVSEDLFRAEAPGNWLERLLAETGMVLGGSREGGFFVVVARKLPPG